MQNIGIYALYWWEQDLVYIGLSQDLHSRKLEHLSKLERTVHTNYKVQSAYNLYGIPDFIILENCSISELPAKEIYWTHEFDALRTGLCIVEPGIVGFGVNSNASKYTKFQILKTFSLLYKNKLSFKEISKRTFVNEGIISDISAGRVHLWISEVYPDKHLAMVSIKNRNHRKRRNKELLIIFKQ
jgi:predicted GIY-YIG superfamily endonuclease